jgi:hypothetical protein
MYVERALCLLVFSPKTRVSDGVERERRDSERAVLYYPRLTLLDARERPLPLRYARSWKSLTVAGKIWNNTGPRLFAGRARSILRVRQDNNGRPRRLIACLHAWLRFRSKTADAVLMT